MLEVFLSQMQFRNITIQSVLMARCNTLTELKVLVEEMRNCEAEELQVLETL